MSKNMTKIELLKMLKKCAKDFRLDHEHYERNSHMHQINEAPEQEVIDAVLTGFINHVGIFQGVDYGLYSTDLIKDEDGNKVG